MTDSLSLDEPVEHSCHLQSTRAGSSNDERRQCSAHRMQNPSALPLQTKCTCTHPRRTNNFLDDKKYTIHTLRRKCKYLGKVCRECIFNNLREVKGFWKSNPAMKFSSGTTDVSKPFQVHTQDTRQGEQSDILKQK